MAQLKAMQQRNNNIAMHFKGYEEFISRISDWEYKAEKYRSVVFTPFLNAYERDIVHSVVRNVFVYEDGGYLDSEMKRMAFSFYEEEVYFPIACLSDTFDAQYHSISHRDILGALLKLGIERKMLGDIFVEDNRIFIIVAEEIKSFVMQELNRIARSPIVLKEWDQEIVREVKLEYRKYTVSSFRLDVIVAAIAKVSREKAKLLIKSGHVKVNQVVLEEYSYLCHNNSTVSIRGHGRFLFTHENQKTKKDRFVITVGKYI